MNNKPQPRKSWGEIQLAIAAVAITATLGFWNLFSVPQKQQDAAFAPDTATPPPPDPTQTSTPMPRFIPVKIIFGGTPPKQQVIVQAAPAQSKRKGGGGAPRPTTSTGSSKP